MGFLFCWQGDQNGRTGRRKSPIFFDFFCFFFKCCETTGLMNCLASTKRRAVTSQPKKGKKNEKNEEAESVCFYWLPVSSAVAVGGVSGRGGWAWSGTVCWLLGFACHHKKRRGERKKTNRWTRPHTHTHPTRPLNGGNRKKNNRKGGSDEVNEIEKKRNEFGGSRCSLPLPLPPPPAPKEI